MEAEAIAAVWTLVFPFAGFPVGQWSPENCGGKERQIAVGGPGDQGGIQICVHSNICINRLWNNP